MAKQENLGLATEGMCDLDQEVVDNIKKLQKQSSNQKNSAIIVKILMKEKRIVLDEELDDCSVEELQEALPERQPRYIVYSYKYKRDDGRISYPLCFIYFMPEGCNPQSSMLYAGSRDKLLQAVRVTKEYKLRDIEFLTEEWLRGQLSSK